MANEENLRPIPWKPGQSGNPNGWSTKGRFKAQLIRLLDEQELDAPLMQAAIDAAKAKDFNFWKYLYELIEGKLPDPAPPEPPLTMETLAKNIRDKKVAKKRKKAE